MQCSWQRFANERGKNWEKRLWVGVGTNWQAKSFPEAG
jgi:hypothetical protein